MKDLKGLESLELLVPDIKFLTNEAKDLIALISRHKALKKAIIEVMLHNLGEKGFQQIREIIRNKIRIPEFQLIEKSGAFND